MTMTMTIDSEDDVSIRSAVAHRHRSIGGIVTFDCSSLMVHCCLAKSGNKVTRAAKQFLCSTKVARRGSALRLARRWCIDYLSAGTSDYDSNEFSVFVVDLTLA